MSYPKPEKILEQLKLHMPVSLTLEDPITQEPMVISYENLHALLVIDGNNLAFESQVVTNLYTEMARWERGAEFAAAREKARYARWKSEKADECRAQAKGNKKPTVNEIESYYRSLEDYEDKAMAEARMLAIAGLFGDLKRAFGFKSKHISDAHRATAGYEQVARREDEDADGRMTDYATYHQMQAELSRRESESGAAEAFQEGAQRQKKKRAGRTPE